MSTCFSCDNKILPGTEQCNYCGQKFHHTHYAVFKRNKKENPKIASHRRFFAGLIDMAYSATPFGLGLFFLQQPLQETTVAQFAGQCWYVIALFAALQLFLLVHDGQTVGKKLMKIAIVMHETHEHPSAFRVLILRTILPVIPFVLPALGVALYAVNLAWMLGGEQRCLHDYIAGTDVIQE